MKIKKEKREIGRAKKEIEAIKKRLQETKACWRKHVWQARSQDFEMRWSGGGVPSRRKILYFLAKKSEF